MTGGTVETQRKLSKEELDLIEIENKQKEKEEKHARVRDRVFLLGLLSLFIGCAAFDFRLGFVAVGIVLLGMCLRFLEAVK